MTWAPRRKYTHVCEQCGVTYNPEGRTQRFCSRACSALGQTLPRPTCERCGKVREDRKHSSRRFCGRTCAAAAAIKPRRTCPVCHERAVALGQKTCGVACGFELRKSRVKPRPCPHCGKEFRPFPSALARSSGKYCSLECARAVQASRPLFLEATCASCGKSFRRIRAALARTKRHACSRACAAALNAGPDGPAWRGGKLTSYRGPGWVQLRQQIRERDGYRCRRCGKAEADNGGRALPVDHIIPWRTFDTAAEANRPENLVALCDSCHGRKARAELKYLNGDVLEMWAYQIAVARPWPDPMQLEETAS